MQDYKKINQWIKHEKLKLHVKYIIIIAITIISIIIVIAGYCNNKFVEQVSFAGTVASIILSVIAIIMTIIGESKSDNVKDSLINLAKELELVVSDVKSATNKLENAAINKDDIDKMQSSIIENVSNLWRANTNTQNELNVDNLNYLELFRRYVEKMVKVSQDYDKYLFAMFYYIILRVKNTEGTVDIDKFSNILASVNLKNKQLLDVSWHSSFAFSPAINHAKQDEELVNYIENSISKKYPNIKSILDLNYN
ncbi:hypothetical protein [Clostridium sp. HBUAS56017]|uniref:hypothetical protein n=1 Tax=Clostridium sp. HBUAS56017 TaxID=2571128 RepID=UPI001177EAA8|nr:hypothetical protein [Clostridium sp. HBUAS56017]